jgi:tetratricopeptide (TPR) repeat protein
MKIKFLMIGLLGLVSATAFAQKGALKDAQESYDQYDISKDANISAVQVKAKQSLDDARASIDKAAANDKTATMPQTYALKAAIYSAMASKDTVATTAAPLLTTAQDAIKKAKDADTKGEFAKLINEANHNVAQYYQNVGVKQYQNKKYEEAYQAFDGWNTYLPDTTAVYYSALAAGQAGNANSKFYAYAITDYNKLLATNFSQNLKIYNYLATLYMLTKDTVNALKTINAGVEKYPGNSTLREVQVRTALLAGKQAEIIGQIDAAITNDPKNKLLYYYKGLTYSRIGDDAESKSGKAKDKAAQASLHKESLDDYAKAADAYKKAIEVDPDYFDANLNLGNALMKPAIDLYNQANSLPSTATQKQYDDLRLKADASFEIAKPYLQKAVDLDPKSSNALSNLRNYYRGKYDPANKDANKAKADDLKKQIDALPASN